MAGGLINIVSQSTNDLYLTGAPQITFFKLVYRRYTNFSMESVYTDFDNNLKFGQESELIPKRIGDLLHKSYLHITLPNISITKQDVGIDTSMIEYNYIDKSAITNYEKIKNVYMKIMSDIYRIIYKAINASNVSYLGLITDVNNYVNQNENLLILANYDQLIDETKQKLIALNNIKINQYDNLVSLFDKSQVNLWTIISKLNISNLLTNSIKNIDKDVFEINSDSYNKELQKLIKLNIFKEIQFGFTRCESIQQYFFDEYIKFTQQINNDANPNIRFAWVENLGHSLIEYIDVSIGGKRIDRHYGVWIDIWYQLTYKFSQRSNYDRMIGNVPALNNFDRQEKPSYDIYVPLTFWFNKFNGLSFPLVSMQYNDIRFSVKLRKFEEVFHIEKVYRALLNGSDINVTSDMIDFIKNRAEKRNVYELTNIQEIENISLDDIWYNKGKMLNGHIIIDYVYLESSERKRFAQSGHEYLIERIQTIIEDNISNTNYDVRLDFTNPSKEIIWAFTKDVYVENKSGSICCKWNNYSCYNNSGNPMIDCQFMINNIARLEKQDGKYFGLYQPLMFHNITPKDGINIYSFCLDPLQHQPTGSCNFSKLSDARLFMNLDKRFFSYTLNNLYPYDQNIDFNIMISNTNDLLEKIDIVYVRNIIEDYLQLNKNENLVGIDYLTNSNMADLVESANSTQYVYEQLSNNNQIEIPFSVYRKILLKTTVKCHIYSLTMNILRIIGGYGALAYSGNN